MNIHDNIARIPAWQTIRTDGRTATLATPFTFGEDGAAIAFTVAFSEDGRFVLTDFAEHAILADSMGAKISKEKFLKLNQTHGIRAAGFNADGEIYATGAQEDLQTALSDATKLALSLSFRYPKWQPKFDADHFRRMVEKTLYASIENERIQKNWETHGASGHPIRFPFAVTADDGSRILIDTLAAKDGRIDWPLVYQTHGKMYDLKQTGSRHKRLIIMEDTGSEDDGRASTLLASAAGIGNLQSAAEILKAA